MTTATVIGSGPNGLAAAVTLASAGVDVTVLEAADVPGGGTRSSELTVPGLLHDECSSAHPLALDTPFSRLVDLGAHGLEWAFPEVQYAHPLDGDSPDSGAAVWRSVDTTARYLHDDSDTWRRVYAPLSRSLPAFAEDFLRPMVHVPTNPVEFVHFGVFAGLPAAAVARLFRTPEARALFAGMAAHTWRPFDSLFSAAIGMVLGTAAHTYGWPVAVGGSRAISRAMVSALEQRGGRVVTGVHVDSLDQVTTADGTRPDLLFFDTSPGTALRVLGDRVPTRIRSALGKFLQGPGAYSVHLAVEGGIPWTYAPARRAGSLHLCGAYEETAAAEALVSRGRMPERPFVLLGQQYLADPSRVSGGADASGPVPIDAYAHVPAGYTGDATEAVLAQIERFAPGFRDRVVATHVRTPAEHAAHNPNYVGGDITTGANDALQLLFRPRPALDPYALGVPGAYLCSAATAPGAGAHGMCGYNAALSALRSRGIPAPVPAANSGIGSVEPS
ncbi:phytoene desaturase family protein [Brevibacterium litoralis]|uniref:phytoene desaturase family protein n=1 Tax=Brevibacterium litoralis TaxID=3138935 RepID=UPI0032EB6D77